MTSQAKSVLMVLLSVSMSLAAGSTVRVIYQGGSLYVPAGSLLFVTLGQIVLAFVRTKEEQQADLWREMRTEQSVQKIAESKAMSALIIQRIEEGDLQEAEKWQHLRDSIL